MVDFCLNNSEQYVGIGWSRLSEGIKSNDFQEYYNRIKQESGKANPAINIFQNAKVDDLFWTRDLNGIYWICRVKSRAEVICDKLMDIGSLIPVEAYNFGMQVPGQIKASFNRVNGGTAGYIRDKIIIEYSKLIFNLLEKATLFYTKFIKCFLLSTDSLSDWGLVVKTAVNAMMIPPVNVVLCFKG